MSWFLIIPIWLCRISSPKKTLNNRGALFHCSLVSSCWYFEISRNASNDSCVATEMFWPNWTDKPPKNSPRQWRLIITTTPYYPGWWFQPIWTILVKMGSSSPILGVKIKKIFEVSPPSPFFTCRTFRRDQTLLKGFPSSQRLFQHTPTAHPRQSPKPIMKEIPL